MASDYIPAKDAEFSVWGHNFVAGVDALRETLRVPEAVSLKLTALFNDFGNKYMIATTPETRTKIAVSDKNHARATVEKEIRLINAEFISHNRNVTDRDREMLGLTIRKTTRTNAPVPTTIPDFNIDTPMLRRLAIRFRDHGSASRAKPEGVHGVEVKWGFASALPDSADELANSSFDTRTPLVLEFADSQRGKTVYFCLRWENTRGEKGPWSAIASAIVP